MIDKDVQEKRLKQGAELGKNDVFLLETKLLMLLGRTAGCIEDHSSFTGVAVRMLESLLQWYGSKPGYAESLQRSLRTRAGLGAECKPEHVEKVTFDALQALSRAHREFLEHIRNSLSAHLSAGEGIGFTIKEKENPAKASSTGNLSGALIDCEMPEDDTKRSCANSDCVHFDGSPICPGCDRIETPSTVACPHVDCHNFKVLKNSGAW